MTWHSTFLFSCYHIVVSVLLTGVSAGALSQTMRLHNEAYDVVYDVQLALPIYCEYICTPNSFGSLTRKAAKDFKVDKRVPKPRARQKDYNNTGYQRGHLCPAADFSCCLDLMQSTFLLTNVVPMRPALNEGRWKTTEIAARQLAVKFGAVRVRVWVFTSSVGRLRLPQSAVNIPTRFAKSISTFSGDSLLCEYSFLNE